LAAPLWNILRSAPDVPQGYLGKPTLDLREKTHNFPPLVSHFSTGTRCTFRAPFTPELLDGLKPHLKQDQPEELPTPNEQATPTDTLEAVHQQLQIELARDLLEQIREIPPSLFERLVVELLVKMGYGGSRKDAGKAIGRSGDEGIDGIINEDKLGLDMIYIQAKRWKENISRPEIQKFAGALQGQRAKKGIFITTSAFTKEAREFTQRIDIKIILIDGEQLAQMLIDHNVGVSVVQIYEVKRIDSDYFTGE
jgi:restriction system protein